MTDLKTQIKNRRVELGLSQDRLGKLIGANDAFISRVEHGKDISVDDLVEICIGLQMDLLHMLVESGYINSESVKRYKTLHCRDSEQLTEQDRQYIEIFIDSLIDKRKSEAEQ